MSGVGRIDDHVYGKNEIGTPYLYRDGVSYFDTGTWFRRDRYTGGINGDVVERRFAASAEDTSPMFAEGVNAQYDSRCSCCYLGFSHTLDCHKLNIGE